MRRITRAGLAGRIKRLRIAVGTRVAGMRPRRVDSGSRTSLATWVRRDRGRRSGTFPDAWRVHPNLPFEQPSRVAVLMHVYYPELMGELLQQISQIPVDVDLIVTNSSGTDLGIDVDSLPCVRNVAVLECANHGRDILPMISVVNAGLLDPYELILKVHTKNSTWRADHELLNGSGAEWREEFLDALLSSTQNIEHILAAFAGEPNLGVVTADGSALGPEFWGGDERAARELLERLGLELDPSALRFPSGSMYWTRGFLLQGLRSLSLTADDFEPEAGQVDGTTAHAVERLVGILAAEAGLRVEERSLLEATGSPQRYAIDAPEARRIRAIPFYLPQFHPTQENDRWWGAGFTEWQNVVAAHPVFPGHHQPRLPAALGFYDLRLDEIREAQQDLAARFGVEGFMYYYYWFAGRRLLSMPIESLVSGTTDKRFCVMWANENWTRRWDGRSTDLLIGQDYDQVPATEFIDDVMDLLRDKRYLRVDGKAVLSIYRISQIPDYRSVLEHWRARAREEGVGELLLISVDVAREFDGLDSTASAVGLDGIHWFPPHNSKWDWIGYSELGADAEFKGNLLSYESLVRDAEERVKSIDASAYPAVMVDFDNTARRQWSADIWYGSNPYTFRRWLAATADAVATREAERRLVFINAWNEWAEGAILEPTVRHGFGYLCAVRDVVRG
ncbi:glycosyl transferase family 2 [Cellulomonas sp. WB94]|uniref:glycoside hydrolase family 99-like domain-containing protein n=1 Tax=Cellulomonas sp. WB94 TaxID=2173174 RepID=UPI000D57D792|nr:glycoside hydrolase family 99-like domain-containing protein [Cellulomonas sp. WB94]PVU82121.1 glycosyl transferase family 2 [Cellulomonas sp. WB94]